MNKKRSVFPILILYFKLPNVPQVISHKYKSRVGVYRHRHKHLKL